MCVDTPVPWGCKPFIGNYCPQTDASRALLLLCVECKEKAPWLLGCVNTITAVVGPVPVGHSPCQAKNNEDWGALIGKKENAPSKRPRRGSRLSSPADGVDKTGRRAAREGAGSQQACGCRPTMSPGKGGTRLWSGRWFIRVLLECRRPSNQPGPICRGAARPSPCPRPPAALPSTGGNLAEPPRPHLCDYGTVFFSLLPTRKAVCFLNI